MGVSYNRLWKMLIDKNMKRIEMQYLTGISGNILARMGKNQYVSMETIEKICKKLDCTVDEIPVFETEKSVVMEVKNVFHRRKRLYYANDKRNGKSIIFFNVWEKVCFC